MSLNKKKFFSLVFATLVATLLFSCKYGLFNMYYPSSIRFILLLNEEEMIDEQESGIFSFDFEDDEVNKKYLKLSCVYTKDGKDVDVYGFEFACNDIEITRLDEKTIGFPLKNVKSLGAHEIQITSSVSSSLNKKFIINVTSQIKDFKISYCQKDEYSDLESIILDANDTNNKEITLLPETEYIFNFTNPLYQALPLIEAKTDKNDIVEISQISNSNIQIKIKNCPTGCRINLEFKMVNSDIKYLLNIVIINKIEITTSEKQKIVDKVLYLEKENEHYQYDLLIKSENGKDEEIFAYFSMQEADEDISSSIYDIQKTKSINLVNHYMQISLDTNKKILDIVTQSDTKDKFLYIYFFDKFSIFISRMRIVIGGVCENIELSISNISSKTEQSGSIKATLKPNKNKNMIWYFTKELPSITFAPSPMTRQEVNTFIYTPNIILENDSIKLSGYTYDCNEYFFAKSYKIDNTFYYTTLLQPISIFLVATDEDKTVWKAIPFQISAEGQIVLKSYEEVIDKLVPTTYYDNDIDNFFSNFVAKNLPAGQFFPHTAENNKYGTMTRCFYLPHNKISTIEIESLFADKNLHISSSSQANNLFISSLDKSNDNNKYIITITPLWYKYQKESEQNDNFPRPCQNNDDDIDKYDKVFYEYIGLGTLFLKIGKAEITIRISLFDNS